MESKKNALLKLEGEYTKSLSTFRNFDLSIHSADAFNELNADLYNSLPKTDLFKIYKKNIVEVIGAYKSIDFLGRKTPSKIYREYADRWKEHKYTTEHQNGHIELCANHKLFIETSIMQIESNLLTCKELRDDIDKILNY